MGDIADVTKLAGFEFTEHVVYSDEGNIIALRGLNIKNGQLILDDVKYIDGSNFSKLSRSKLFIDDIMFTYVGTVGEVAIIKENDRFYLAPNVSRIRVKSDDSPKFISYYMRTDNFKNKVIFPLIATSSQPALSMENIRKFTINIPISREEQDCLAKYFDNLDHLITLHQRKYEKLLNVKKSMLEKMFPQNGSKVPEIRFSGFADDWEQRKLKEIADKVSEKNKNNEFSEPFTNSAEQGIISQKDYFDREIVNNENLDSYYIVRNDDFIYNPRISVMAPVGPINRNRLGRNGVMSPLYTVFRTHDIDNLYLEFYFKTTKWHRFMKSNGDSGARFDRFTISSTQFMEMPIPYPMLDEQRKIGEYFDSLDNLITLHQRKLEKLQNVKKSCLEKMFV